MEGGGITGWDKTCIEMRQQEQSIRGDSGWAELERPTGCREKAVRNQRGAGMFG